MGNQVTGHVGFEGASNATDTYGSTYTTPKDIAQAALQKTTGHVGFEGATPPATDIYGSIHTYTIPKKHLKPVVYNQKESTCYAHAVASAVHHAESRIWSRKPQSHWEYADKVIQKFGMDGANTWKAAQWLCQERGIHSQIIQDPIVSIEQGRPVIACFYLDGLGWKKFRRFFEDNPDSVLDDLDNIDIDAASPAESILNDLVYDNDGGGSHAVVIIGMHETKNYWKIKNSWGESWASKGFFRVAFDCKGLCFHECIDVYYTINDLTDAEKQAWNKLDDKSKEAWKKEVAFHGHFKNSQLKHSSKVDSSQVFSKKLRSCSDVNSSVPNNDWQPWCKVSDEPLSAGTVISWSMSWKDQGRGNRKGKVALVEDIGEEGLVCHFETAETAQHSQSDYSTSYILTKDVSNLEFRFRVGGGGGHRLFISNLQYTVAVPDIREPRLCPDVSSSTGASSIVWHPWCKVSDEPLSAGTVISWKMSWRDQGWGYRKGRVGLFEDIGEGDPIRHFESELASHSQSDYTNYYLLTKDVRNLEFRFYVGGGGGHELFISDCKYTVALPVIRSCPDVKFTNTSTDWHPLCKVSDEPLSAGTVISWSMSWRDQGWGYRKGMVALFEYIGDQDPIRHFQSEHAPHSQSDYSNSHILEKDVRNLEFRFYVGGGGGHKLFITNFESTVFSTCGCPVPPNNVKERALPSHAPIKPTKELLKPCITFAERALKDYNVNSGDWPDWKSWTGYGILQGKNLAIADGDSVAIVCCNQERLICGIVYWAGKDNSLEDLVEDLNKLKITEKIQERGFESLAEFRKITENA